MIFDRLMEKKGQNVDLNKEFQRLLAENNKQHLIKCDKNGVCYNKKFVYFCFLYYIFHKHLGKEYIMFVDGGKYFKVPINDKNVMDFNEITVYKPEFKWGNGNEKSKC